MEGKMKNIFFYTCLILLSFLYVISSANAQSWEHVTNGLPANLGMSAVLDSWDENTVVIGNGRSVFRTLNGGSQWNELPQPTNLTGTIVDIALIDSEKIWIASSSGQILFTPNAGNDWTEQFFNDTLVYFMNYIEMFDAQIGVAMGDNASLISDPGGPAIILRTTDGGQNWVSVNDSAFGASSGDTWRRIDFVNADVGYFFPSGKNPQRMYKTSNGGSNWSQINYPAYAQILKFFDEKIGLAISEKSKVLRTTDGGQSWQQFTSGHNGWGNDIEFSPENPAFVWLTDKERIYFSSDTGKTWKEQYSKGGTDLEFVNDTTGWCVGIDGLFYFHSTATSVPEIDKGAVEKFTLLQNYPNPFNGNTAILYILQKPMRVSLQIFDIKGRLVVRLVDEFQSAGKHEILWAGEEFSSGTYFCRLQVGNQVQVRKILLLK